MTIRQPYARGRRAVSTRYFPFDGGLNLVDAPLKIPDGMVIGAQNYELLSRGGYRRIDGYERYDGQPSPSDADYWILDFDAGSAAINNGDTVTGGTSGATAVAVADAVVETGSYGGGDATGYIALTAVSGTFQDNEALQVSSVTKSTANGTPQLNNADTDALDATYRQSAIEYYRGLIGTVGGASSSGPVRGVNVYNGEVYAFRDNSGGTACEMWKATSSGWVKQDLGNLVKFTTGTAAYVEGETLTGGTSGASATILRVVLQSGTWGTDAAGYLVIGPVTSGPFQNETATSASGSATLTGAEVSNNPPAGGHYEFVNHNFYATSGTYRMYGVNGVGPAFEYDGTVFTPILSGNTNDRPTHIAEYKDHLFLAFEKGSLQHSAPGQPYPFVATGSGEIGVGDDIVGIREEIGDALAVLSRNRTKMLYGSTTSDFTLKTINDESGGIEWTMQRIGRMRYLDDRGYTDLTAVQAYGSFKSAVFSQVIEPLVTANKLKAVESVIVKSKNQYRTFFNDGTVICATFDGNKIRGFMPFSYQDAAGQPLVVSCAVNGEDSSGNEVVFVGTQDGYVYQLDKGSSFDGTAIPAFIRLNFMHFGSPEAIKRFFKAVLEVDSKSTISLYFTADFDYSERDDIQQLLSVLSGGGYWNVSNWNQFLWSSPGVGNPETHINGRGKNMGILLYSEETYAAPHTIHGAVIHYETLRRSR